MNPAAMMAIYCPHKCATARKIAAYFASGKVCVDAQGAAIAIIPPHSPDVSEILNIALAGPMREQGHARAFLQDLIDMLKARGAPAIEIGIGNSRLDQLALYQRLGFFIIGIVAGFFVDYPEPIVENGISCRDMEG